MPITENLWPELEKSTIVTPIAIMKEQGSYLEKATKGLLKASISTSKDWKGGNLVHRFSITAPSLDSLSIELLRVEHGVFIYPAEVHFDEGVFKVEDENDFVQVLEKILNDPKTFRAMNGLMSQAQDSIPDDLPF